MKKRAKERDDMVQQQLKALNEIFIEEILRRPFIGAPRADANNVIESRNIAADQVDVNDAA